MDIVFQNNEISVDFITFIGRLTGKEPVNNKFKIETIFRKYNKIF